MANRVVDEGFSDELLSSQWAAHAATNFLDMPERRLLIAVLLDAARLMRSGNVKERRAVGAWIQGLEARVPFQALCDGLELEANYVARKLRREGPVSAPRRLMTTQSRKIQCVEPKPPRPNPVPVPAEEAQLPEPMSA